MAKMGGTNHKKFGLRLSFKMEMKIMVKTQASRSIATLQVSQAETFV